MSVSAEISKAEMAKFRREVQQFAKGVGTTTQRNLAKAGLEMDRIAKLNSPVDTGRLVQSLHIVSLDGGYTVEERTNVEYAKFVENGTSRQKARRFLFKGQQAGIQMFKSLMNR